jgi:microcystin-dependent protein
MPVIRRLMPALILSSLYTHVPLAHAQSTPLLGQLMCAGFSFAPVGWLPADGRLMSIAQNTALFSLLGINYGGDGITTFALPDTRGRVVLGAGAGPNLTARNVGETGGVESEVLRVDQLPAHVHLYAPPATTTDATQVSPRDNIPATKARTTLYASPTTANLSMAVAQTGPTGGNAPVATLPPYLVVNCFIAVQGVFPSRP